MAEKGTRGCSSERYVSGRVQGDQRNVAQIEESVSQGGLKRVWKGGSSWVGRVQRCDMGWVECTGVHEWPI